MRTWLGGVIVILIASAPRVARAQDAVVRLVVADGPRDAAVARSVAAGLDAVLGDRVRIVRAGGPDDRETGERVYTVEIDVGSCGAGCRRTWRAGTESGYLRSPTLPRTLTLFAEHGALGLVCIIAADVRGGRCLVPDVTPGENATDVGVPPDATGGLAVALSHDPAIGRAADRTAGDPGRYWAVFERVQPRAEAPCGDPRGPSPDLRIPATAEVRLVTLPEPRVSLVLTGTRVSPKGRVHIEARARRRVGVDGAWVPVAIQELLRDHELRITVDGCARSWRLEEEGWVAVHDTEPLRPRTHGIAAQLAPRVARTEVAPPQSARMSVVTPREAVVSLRATAGEGATCTLVPEGAEITTDLDAMTGDTAWKVWTEGIDASGRAGPRARLCARAPAWERSKRRTFRSPEPVYPWWGEHGHGGDARTTHLTVRLDPDRRTLWFPFALLAAAAIAFLIAVHFAGARRAITHVATRRVRDGYRGEAVPWTVRPLCSAAEPAPGVTLARVGGELRVEVPELAVAIVPGHPAAAVIGSVAAVAGMIVCTRDGARVAFLRGADTTALDEPSPTVVREALGRGLTGEVVIDVPRADVLGRALVAAGVSTAIALGVGVVAGAIVPALATGARFAAIASPIVLLLALAYGWIGRRRVSL